MLRIDANLLFTIINLIVLFLLLRFFLIKPVMAVIEKRENMIREQLENAGRTEKKAGELKEKYEAALAGVEDEAGELIAKARDRAKAEQESIIANANLEAGKIIKEAHAVIELEKQQEMTRLQNQVANLALNAVEKVLSEQLNEEQNDALYDRFLKETGGTYDTDRA